MANKQNLKRLSPSEARKNGKKGGIASGKKRRQLKTFKELFNAVLQEPALIEGKEWGSKAEYLAARVYNQAAKGDIKAFEVIRDTIGQKPVEQVQQLEPVKILDDVDLVVKKPKKSKK